MIRSSSPLTMLLSRHTRRREFITSTERSSRRRDELGLDLSRRTKGRVVERSEILLHGPTGDCKRRAAEEGVFDAAILEEWAAP